MALLSKEEHEGLLRRIAESGGATPDMLDEIQKLRDDYDEREGMLRRESETYDGEDNPGEEVESRGESAVDAEDVSRETNDDWREKYEDIRRKYIERFFTTPEEVKEEQTEDVKEDGENVSYETLFKRKEG